MQHEPDMSLETVEEILLRADAAKEPVPDFVEETLISYYRRHCALRPEVNVALHRLPAERFIRFSKQLQKALAEREAQLENSTEVAFAEWVNDPAFERDWIDGVVLNAHEALRTKNFHSVYHTLTSMFRCALGGSIHAVGLFDRALTEIATHVGFATSPTGAALRLLFRRVRFYALRGTSRDLDTVMPGEDIRFIHHVDDAIGKEEPLAGLLPAQIDTLFDAWAAMDWDNTLYLETVFGRDSSPPAIAARPWPELVALVKKTSLERLRSGERKHRSLSQLFERPEPLSERIALAESIALFAKTQGSGGNDTMKAVLGAIVPHVTAAHLELAGALEAAAFKAFRDGELQDVLLELPKRQVRVWINKLVKGKSEKHKRLGQEYADKLAQRD
jgi:hypothetical protein